MLNNIGVAYQEQKLSSFSLNLIILKLITILVMFIKTKKLRQSSRRLYNKAISIKPDYVDVYYNKGITLHD